MKFSLVSTDARSMIGLNTLSMIAKLYVVTYIPLKSQKSEILSLSMGSQRTRSTRERRWLALFADIKRRKSAREDTQTPKNPLVDGHDTPPLRRIRNAEKYRGGGQGK